MQREADCFLLLNQKILLVLNLISNAIGASSGSVQVCLDLEGLLLFFIGANFLSK